jgi:cellulose synthase/poly-beta-1,6-N-acetylglucosamine synthase-like glycosyltransferase
MMEIAFWLFAFLVAYIYAGYPLVLLALPRRYTPRPASTERTPRITLFIAAYNEEAVIREKIENSLALDYPPDALEIVVASDASSDRTGAIADEYVSRGVKVFHATQRQGKNAAINAFLPQTTGELIVFTDANSFYQPDALKKLARHFSDPAVGLVVGHLKYIDQFTSVAKGEGLYFRYETAIKRLQSRHGAVVAATGSIYAVRRELTTKDLDLDVANDLSHPITTASRGYRLLFEPEAIALEKATEESSDEFKRRARIVTRGYTALGRYWRSHHMFRGFWGFCFVSHKLLRWLTTGWLLGLLITSLFLPAWPYRLMLAAQIAFYGLAVAGRFTMRRNRLTTVPFYFCLVNLAAAYGAYRFVTSQRQSVWEVARTTR